MEKLVCEDLTRLGPTVVGSANLLSCICFVVEIYSIWAQCVLQCIVFLGIACQRASSFWSPMCLFRFHVAHVCCGFITLSPKHDVVLKIDLARALYGLQIQLRSPCLLATVSNNGGGVRGWLPERTWLLMGQFNSRVDANLVRFLLVQLPGPPVLYIIYQLPYTIYYILHTIMLYITHAIIYVLCGVQRVLYTMHNILYAIYHIIYTIYYILYTIYWFLCTIYWWGYSLHNKKT